MNHNIRKRRAYSPEDFPTEPVLLQGFTHPSPYSPGTISLSNQDPYIQALSTPMSIGGPAYMFLNSHLPEYQHYIHEQAASNLWKQYPNLDLNSQYLDFSYPQHHVHKRLRPNPNIHMPTQYAGDSPPQNGQEKSPLASQLGSSVNVGRKSFGSSPESGLSHGWTAGRIAGCLASLCAPCSPFESQPAYQPLTPSAYDYDDRGSSALDTAIVSMQPHAQSSLLPTPITPGLVPLFPCDDTSPMTQFLPTYPPLQPTQALGVQPATIREEMIYPETSPLIKYDGNAGSPSTGAGLGIQGQPFMDSPLETSTMPGAYATGGELSPYNGHNEFMDPTSRFHLMQDLDVKPGAELFCAHEGPAAALDFYHRPKPTPVKRGPFRDQDQREKTALTRKMGSCIRCRMQRIRCNLDPENEQGPCLSCKKIATSTRVYRLNCLRLKITDVRLYKPGMAKGQEWTIRWSQDTPMAEIDIWDSSQIKTIHVTEGYTGKSIPLRVRQFKPLPGDKLERTWVNTKGEKKSAKIPTYAILNMDEARVAIKRYIKDGLQACCNHFMAPRSALLRRTYALALKTAANPSTDPDEMALLVALLDLWMSIRLTTKSFEIVGKETLDMPRDIINDPDSPDFGKYPIPPVMGAQIDSIIIQDIQPQLRQRTLNELQKMTQAKKQRTWLTTFLATLILLHNLALITKHDANYAKKHGYSTHFAREHEVKEYNMGANTLLAYFHYCNKAVYPFSDACKDQELQSLANLDDEAISFVHFTRRFVAEHQKEWEDLWLKDGYEEEDYYMSQLFEQNWQPRSMA